MKSEVASGIVLTLLFIGVLAFAFRIQPVKAWIGGTIYIRADGSVEPSGAPISSIDNFTYTLNESITCNLFEGTAVTVERSNITVDGNGYTVQGTSGAWFGFNLTSVAYVRIMNVEIKDFVYSGIQLFGSYKIIIQGNNITNNGEGIYMAQSVSTYGVCSYNSVYGNNITNNSWMGIYLKYSSNNTICGNNITNSEFGIGLTHASNNTFYHNCFIGNTNHVGAFDPSYFNIWDDGYPSGGNYWSNYTGVDVKKGPGQNQDGSDGIGDTAHIINAYNTDHYPLMNPRNITEAIIEVWGAPFPLVIDSNLAIEQLNHTETPDNLYLRFRASGPTGQTGVILLIVPMIVPPEEIRVFIDGVPPQWPFPLIDSDGINYLIYFEFTLSTHNIAIQFGPTPVGGIYIPVDKLGLLAPYLISIITIILVASVTVAYIKYRKKQ